MRRCVIMCLTALYLLAMGGLDVMAWSIAPAPDRDTPATFAETQIQTDVVDDTDCCGDLAEIVDRAASPCKSDCKGPLPSAGPSVGGGVTDWSLSRAHPLTAIIASTEDDPPKPVM